MKMKHALRRKLVQIAAFGFSNTHLTNFRSGRIYQGKWKQFCNPGLNCYSCPAAGLSCPIGALQAVGGSMNFQFSFYVAGFLLAVGALFGRAVCGWVCPFGLFQELLHKIPSPKWKLPGWMRYLKYGILLVFVILLPVAATDYMGMGKPAFCQFICPAGTLEGGLPLLGTHPELRQSIGALFFLKAAVLVITLGGCVFAYRFFCRVMCPLGAIYGLMNRVSFFRLEVDPSKCINCGKCARECGMEVDPVRTPDCAECIRCGDCARACPAGAIRLGFRRRYSGKKG